MKIQLTKLGSKLSKVSLKFESEDIHSGALKSIYDRMGKVMRTYPRINKPESILYYDFKDQDRLKKTKQYFEQMIEVHKKQKKPFQGSNQGTVKQK